MINSGRLCGATDSHWDEFISDRQNHEVALLQETPPQHLSESELRLIEAVYLEHGGKDQWQLRDWCHEHCEEWTPLEEGRDLIALERVARAVGKTQEQIVRMK